MCEERIARGAFEYRRCSVKGFARIVLFGEKNLVATKVSTRTNDHVDRSDTSAATVNPLSYVENARVCAIARARPALGYADERQIKMHNPGKSFRIFHNGREISLLAGRAIHPYTSNRRRSLRPSREPRANPSVTVRYEGEEIETETQQADERWRKRGRGIYRARKEDGRGTRGRTREGEGGREKCT